MAVSNQDIPNLAPSYGQIMNQLQERARIESNRPSPLDIATTIVKRTDEELSAKRLFDRKMSSEGRVLATKEKLNEFAKELGVEPKIFKKFEGLYVRPEEMSSLGEQEVFAMTFPEPQKQAAARVDPKTAAASVFPKSTATPGKRIQNLEFDGKTYAVPIDVYEAATKNANETGRPLTDFINLSAFALAGYKPTVAKNPQTGELIGVSGSLKTKQITGPNEKPENVPLRNDFNQLNAVEKKRVEDAGKEVVNDKTIKELKDVRFRIGNLRKEIELNLPQGLGPAQSTIARVVAGEGSRLTEDDVARSSGSQAFGDRFKRYVEKAKSGKMLESDVKGFLQLIDLVEKGTNTVLDETIDNYVDRVHSTMKDVDPSVIKGRIGVRAPTGSSSVRIQKQGGKTYRNEYDFSGKLIKSEEMQ